MLSVVGFLLSPITGFFSRKGKCDRYKVAVILSGCGVYDGTDVHEASACLVHLSRFGVEVTMFAPFCYQKHIIDHTNGLITSDNRNTLVESARIGRGKVHKLCELCACDFDAMVVPGGFGVAKNLSTFAFDGPHLTVDPVMDRIMRAFHCQRKPIGMSCISGVLAARVFPGCEVTLGHEEDECGKWPHSEATVAVRQLGAKHCVKDVGQVHLDRKNLLVTTPGFMCDADVHEVYEGIGKMIECMLNHVP